MERMQLIQLHSLFHGENDAVDSAARLHSGWACAQGHEVAPPEWKHAAESAASFSPWTKTMQLNQLHPFHIFYYETYFSLWNEEYFLRSEQQTPPDADRGANHVHTHNFTSCFKANGRE